MSDTLLRVGQLDLDDPAAAVETLDQLRQLVRTLAHHLTIEDRFVLPAIEARYPGATATNAHEHREHERAFDALTDAAASARACDRGPATRVAAGSPSACTSICRGSSPRTSST